MNTIGRMKSRKISRSSRTGNNMTKDLSIKETNESIESSEQDALKFLHAYKQRHRKRSEKHGFALVLGLVVVCVYFFFFDPGSFWSHAGKALLSMLVVVALFASYTVPADSKYLEKIKKEFDAGFEEGSPRRRIAVSIMERAEDTQDKAVQKLLALLPDSQVLAPANEATVEKALEEVGHSPQPSTVEPPKPVEAAARSKSSLRKKHSRQSSPASKKQAPQPGYIPLEIDDPLESNDSSTIKEQDETKHP